MQHSCPDLLFKNIILNNSLKNSLNQNWNCFDKVIVYGDKLIENILMTFVFILHKIGFLEKNWE